MNDDNLLDFFNPMHGHPFPKQFENRMEIGIAAGDSGDAVYSLENHSERIICTDKPDCNLEGLDAHGSVVVDLDGDGNLDILIIEFIKKPYYFLIPSILTQNNLWSNK